MGGGGRQKPESDAEIATRLSWEENARMWREKRQQAASAKLAEEMESTFQAADNYVPPLKPEIESSCEGDESSQLVFSNSETVSGQSVLAGNRFESLVDESEDDQFPPLPSVQRVLNPWQVVEHRGSKKKKVDKPSPEIPIPLQMVTLAEQHHDKQRKDFELSQEVLEGLRRKFTEQE
ncbi:unnamed protein product, partial [Ectocarpus sp. 12 AP-2014]